MLTNLSFQICMSKQAASRQREVTFLYIHGITRGSGVTHMRLHTRPSRYSACNIEKLGVAWRQG